MDPDAFDGRPADYVRTLRGFGLTPGEIAAYHGIDEVPAGIDRRAALADELSGLDASALTDRLHRTLAKSQHGIDAPREYWSHAPQIHLEEVLDPYGCDVRLRDDAGSPLSRASDDGEIEIAVRDRATGEVRRTTFRYPEHPLGTDNYPALIAAVEDDILAPTSLTLVMLADRGRGWQFVLLEEDRLARLRERLGDRIAPFGEPLLHEDDPATFAAAPGRPSRDEAAFMAAVTERLQDLWESVWSATAVDTDAILDRYNITDPAAVADPEAGEGRHEVPDEEREQDVVADAGDLAGVTGDLAEVSLTAGGTADGSDRDAPAASGEQEGTAAATGADTDADDAEALAIAGGEFDVEDGTVEGDLDEVFSAIERDVAEETAGPRVEPSAGDDAVDELVDELPELEPDERGEASVPAAGEHDRPVGMDAFERVRRELHTETPFEWVGEGELAGGESEESVERDDPWTIADGGSLADDD